MKKKLFYFLFCVTALLNFVQAENFNDSISIQLSTVEVSANKAKLYSEMGRILTVIDKKEIEQLPVKSIDALLESIPGMDMRQRGVDGTQTDISMRGGTFDQVLVLLNGVNITDPQTGHYNLDVPIELSDVARIEILQGSAARLLGPNAFSGAINIVTESQSGKHLSLTAEGGSYGAYLGNVSVGFGDKKLKNFLSLTHKASDGHINNTDYRMTNIFAQSVLSTNSWGKFDLQLAYQQKNYGADGFYHAVYRNQFERLKTIFGALNWDFQKDKLSLNGQVYTRLHHDRYEFFRNFDNAPAWYTSHYYHLTQVTGGKATAQYLSTAGKFMLGADIRNEHIYSTTLGKPMTPTVVDKFEKNTHFLKEDNRLSATLFANYAVNINRFYISTGLAHTYNDAFGNYTFGGADFGYMLNKNLNMYLGLNNAVRLPTFTDLYYSTATHQANSNLKPENAKTIETGAKYDNKAIKASLSVFYRQGENVIDWIKYAGDAKYQSTNLTAINTVGTEMSVAYRFANSFVQNVQLSYSFLQADKKATGYDSQYALDYLKHKATIDFAHKIVGALNAMWTYGYYNREGTYVDVSTANSENYKPYHILDLKLRYKISSWDIYALANNILNTQYLDYGGMPQPGFNVRVGVKYVF